MTFERGLKELNIYSRAQGWIMRLGDSGACGCIPKLPSVCLARREPFLIFPRSWDAEGPP